MIKMRKKKNWAWLGLLTLSNMISDAFLFLLEVLLK